MLSKENGYGGDQGYKSHRLPKSICIDGRGQWRGGLIPRDLRGSRMAVEPNEQADSQEAWL